MQIKRPELDYTMPFSEGWSMEGGAQYVLNDVSNDYEVENLIGGDYVLDPDYTNVFNYNQNVFGLYGTGAYELGNGALRQGFGWNKRN